VYLVGHAVAPPLARELAAALACGEGAVVSHDWAGAIFGIRPPTSGPIDITIPSCSTRVRPGIRVHRTRRLDAPDTCAHEGVPLTSPARTLLDLAEILPRKELQRAVEQAQILRCVRVDELHAIVARSSGFHGTSGLRSLLAAEPALTRSEAERRLLELLRAAEIAPAATNARVGRHEVDFLWTAERLVVEVDGYAYHSNRAAFERDRARDAALQAAGYRVMRATWRQINSSPEALIARVARALAVP
jgi:very-short-patch-repair endonuclease